MAKRKLYKLAYSRVFLVIAVSMVCRMSASEYLNGQREIVQAGVLRSLLLVFAVTIVFRMSTSERSNGQEQIVFAQTGSGVFVAHRNLNESLDVSLRVLGTSHEVKRKLCKSVNAEIFVGHQISTAIGK